MDSDQRVIDQLVDFALADALFNAATVFICCVQLISDDGNSTSSNNETEKAKNQADIWEPTLDKTFWGALIIISVVMLGVDLYFILRSNMEGELKPLRNTLIVWISLLSTSCLIFVVHNVPVLIDGKDLFRIFLVVFGRFGLTLIVLILHVVVLDKEIIEGRLRVPEVPNERPRLILNPNVAPAA